MHALINSLRRRTVKRFRDQSGLTLIELLVSMIVFLVVSAGVASTLTTGLKTTLQTRVATMGKAEAQEQIEEMRARVYYVPYSVNSDTGTTADIDLLDKYYPNLVSQETTDSEGWRGWYTYAGGDAYYTKVKPADAKGITRTVVTRFVANDGTTIIPQSSYDSNVEGGDTPPSDLVSMSVTTSWTDAVGANEYELNTVISSTGQTVQGAGDATGEAGCNSTSNNYIDVFGGTFSFGTGVDDPYTQFIDGNFGEGHAAFNTGCDTSITGKATGGKIVINGNTSKGSDVSVTGPPSSERSSGPSNFSQASSWPQWSITGSKVEGEAETDEDEMEGEGEATVGGMSFSPQEIDGWPGSLVSGYKQWDFVNPMVQVTGGVNGGEDDDDHKDDQAEAEIEKEGGTIEGEGEAYYQQVNILPLQAKTASTPSAAQGLIFVRNFNAEVKGHVNGTSGASPTATYSATIGMFNQSKSSSCSGDACYDLYSISGSTSVANTIQSVINLNSSNYRLQKALFTEMTSATKQQINSAITYTTNGKNLTFNLDAMLKISALVGTEVRMSTSNPYGVTLINQQGLAQVWLGSISMTLSQG